MMPDNTPWAEVPPVTIYRAACPRCWADEYHVVRSEANGDGSVTRKAVCDRCHRRFKIIVEPLPEFGRDD
jgi:hypothetical protein